MMMSPSSIRSATCCTTLSVMPAGIITQATRGFSSFWTNSSSVFAPTAPSPASWSTVSGFVSYATAVCPSRMMRRTMLAPMRPNPIIPNCMSALLAGGAVAADECVGGAVVTERGFVVGRELAGDLLRQHLAQFDAPLVEGVDRPDRALREDTVLVQRDERAQRVGRQAFEQHRVGRTVALEHAMRDEPVFRPLGADLVGGLAERQRLAL